ncbi:beta-galactosidase [Halobacteriales archaeon QS_1_67_19]|nr:MAG: beta-galactosidase [Halobacteriales archaeon QS_1_67_19]
MAIGVCYFPEHWSREQWERDVQRMADAGFEYVRMGEFSWSRLEPERGEFETDWLAAAVDLVDEHGMQAVLCTPTATPPKWLVDEHPEIRQVDRDGTPREFGSRRHYCFNSPVYREETERIVRTLAERFADAPIAGWQLDNEYGCHGTVRCYCEDCATRFRDWLEAKYGGVDALNEAWGTAFWSQEHGRFDEIDPPGPTPAEHHPSRLLDYYRFASDSVVEYNRLQADLIRDANDEWFVTHNFMGTFSSLDAYDVAADLDFATWDSYPTGFVQDRRQDEPSPAELRAGDPDQVGLNHDIYRAASDGAFWVMEQQPGDINWPPVAPQPAEGAMRLWAHHAVGHGSDEVCYFRWRRCLMGQEQYHAGLRKQDGSADRGYRDAARAAQELEDLSGWSERVVSPDVALLHEYDNLWALSEQPHAPDFDYWAHLSAWYRALRARGVSVDVIPPRRDLSGYSAVIAPTLHLIDGALADRLARFEERGGELLFTIRSGYKDRANKLRDELPPGPLAELVGTTVAQHESLPAGLDRGLTYDGKSYTFRTWAEWLAPDEATVAGEHTAGVAAGRPAITRKTDSGGATYCGVWPSADLADALVTDVLDRAGVTTTPRLPDGVRVHERGDHLWVTNFGATPVSVAGDLNWALGDGELGACDVAVARGSLADVEAVRIEDA